MSDTREYTTLIQCEHVFRSLLVDNRAVFVIDELNGRGMIPNDGAWLTQLLLNIQPTFDDATGVLMCWLKKYLREEENQKLRINMISALFLASLEIAEPEYTVCCLLSYAIDRWSQTR